MLARGAGAGGARVGSVSIRYIRMKPRTRDTPTQAWRFERVGGALGAGGVAGAAGGAASAGGADAGSLSAPTTPASVGVLGGSGAALPKAASKYPVGMEVTGPSAAALPEGCSSMPSVSRFLFPCGPDHRTSKPE